MCSENKGADQLRGYREADLRLCFRICKSLVFSHAAHLKTYMVGNSEEMSSHDQKYFCLNIFIQINENKHINIVHNNGL